MHNPDNNLEQLKTHIGHKLKDLRLQKGLSMEVLAGLVDIDLPNYLYLEKGRKGAPKLETLCKLALFYELPISYFFQDYKLTPSLKQKNNPLENKLLTAFRRLKPISQRFCVQFVSSLKQK